VSGWTKDADYLDQNGRPSELPLEGDRTSFSSLVKTYGGDVPSRAVRDELIRAGIVEEHDGRLRLVSRGYIVREGQVEKLHILGADVSELISTIHHNTVSPPEEAFLQRKVSYDDVPVDLLEELRRRIFQEGVNFVDSMDQTISRYDRDMNPSLQGEGRRQIGIGVYYFENEKNGEKPQEERQ
jgi:hypothetical protein